MESQTVEPTLCFADNKPYFEDLMPKPVYAFSFMLTIGILLGFGSHVQNYYTASDTITIENFMHSGEMIL